MKASHVALLVLINLVWALNVVALKMGVLHLQPLAAAFVRFTIVLAVCLPFLRGIPGKLPLVLLTGLVSGAGYNGLNAIGFRLADNVSSLALAGQLGVPFSIILAAIFLRERIASKRLIGIILALLGVGMVTFDTHIFDERLGLMLVVLACLFWAAGSLLFRHLNSVSVLNIHGWLALVSLPCLGAGSLLFEPGALAGTMNMPLATWGWLAFSALGSSVLGHIGMSWLLQRYPISFIMPLTIPSPLLSVLFALVAFGLPLTMELALGSMMTIVGVAIITMQSSRQEKARKAGFSQGTTAMDGSPSPDSTLPTR